MSRSGLDKRTSIDLVKLLVFIVVTSLATSLLVILIGNLTFGAKREYKAVFTDVTGVNRGDDVRVAGVKVGSVTDIEIVERNRALLTLDVDTDVALTRGTHASIRYRNLVGQRYVALEQQVSDASPQQGAAGTARPAAVNASANLPEGATIPIGQTSPALDLTVLFNGFKPLFAALSPEDVNQLSFEIVQVFQGESGTLEGLLAHTASVTSTLADRDQVIGDLITNLNDVLVHLGSRDEELTRLIGSFRQLVGGLKDDREAILGSLENISSLSVETADLVQEIRSPFVRDIKQLRQVAGNIDRNKAELDRALQVLPIKLRKIGRTATYGSWFNFSLCSFQGRIVLPGKTVTVPFQTGSGRCKLR